MMSTWRSECGTYTVHLADSALKKAEHEARASLPHEVGTPLVGEYSDDGHEARVTGIAPVSSDSEGTRFSFLRGVRGLRDFFASLFGKSKGRVHYVGEWHSHPGGTPSPSFMDDNNMFLIAQDDAAQCPECILVILSIYEDGTDVGVFVYSRTRGRIGLTTDLRPAKNDRPR